MIYKNCKIVVPEKRFSACFGSNLQISKLILKDSLTYFIQYFASVLAYTGAVADIRSKKKGNDQELTKFLSIIVAFSGFCVYACYKLRFPFCRVYSGPKETGTG